GAGGGGGGGGEGRGRRGCLIDLLAAAPREAQEEEGETAAMTEALQVEATGETVGEAKWAALRELEKLQPGIDKAAVRFQVVSEGERGLLGVGFAPARVIATVDPEAVALAAARPPPPDEAAPARGGREVAEA